MTDVVEVMRVRGVKVLTGLIGASVSDISVIYKIVKPEVELS